MAQQVRRELTRQELARRGVIAILGLAMILGLIWMRSTGTFGGDPQVVARMRDAGGSLTKGADVKIRGVIVGKVNAIDRAPGGGVQVRIKIPAEDLRMLPSNVVARILPATVFGTTFVDLVSHGKATGRQLQPNAVIPADSTQGTLELQQALDDIDTLVKAVGPADLASAIGAAASALDGRGLQLGATIDRAYDYLRRLNPRMPLVREDLRLLADNLEIARDVLPDFFRATSDGLVTARTIVEQEASLTGLLLGVTRLTKRADSLLLNNKDSLVRFVDNAAALLNVVYLNRVKGIGGAFDTNIELGRKLQQVVERGFIKVTLDITLSVPPYYQISDCPRYGPALGDNCGGTGRVAASTLLGGGQ